MFWRQPLLQGAGTFYNRIAGPYDPFTGTGTVQFDGVVLARIRTDISLADFEAGVRNLVNEVENGYWICTLPIVTSKRSRSAATARCRPGKKSIRSNTTKSRGGEADKEAQAREQYYFFRSQVETGLSDLYRAKAACGLSWVWQPAMAA